MLERLAVAHAAGDLDFFGHHAALKDGDAFRAFLKPLHRAEWVVYAKRPFAGPEQVLSYLARYTHRVAIGNSRLLAFDGGQVSFKWKNYRSNGVARRKVMTLSTDEFMRRFLLHVLPDGFHRIRHYGLFANAARKANVEMARRCWRRQRRPKHPATSLIPPIAKLRPRPVHVAAGA